MSEFVGGEGSCDERTKKWTRLLYEVVDHQLPDGGRQEPHDKQSDRVVFLRDDETQRIASYGEQRRGITITGCHIK